MVVVRRRPALLEAVYSVSACVGGARAAGVQAVDDLADEGVPISPKSQRSGVECLSSKAMSSHLLSRKVTFGCSVGGRRLREARGTVQRRLTTKSPRELVKV